jgi:hypothetical protein
MTTFKRLFLLAPLLLILVAAFAATPAFAAGPAVIVSESAEQVTETTATIKAEVNPEGYETIVYLEYGSELYAKPVTLAAGETVQEVKFALKGLQANTTYPFHVSAFSAQGLVADPEKPTFKTLKTPVHGAEPWWHLTSGSVPAYIPSEGTGQILLTASNLGDADANGAVTPVTVTDTLPPGLKAIAMGGIAGAEGEGSTTFRGGATCPSSKELKEGAALVCTFSGVLPPYEALKVFITVEAQPGAAESGEVNRASVSGGGAPREASATRPVTISETPVPFGVENYELTAEEEGGAPDTQAGSHPFQLTTTLALNQTSEPAKPPALAKDLHFILPPGVVGNPTVFPQCPIAKFTESLNGEPIDLCPNDTAMGTAMVKVIYEANFGEVKTPLVETVPLFNLTPSVGEPARFGFYIEKVPVFLDTSVRTGGDYGVTVSVDNITQSATFISSQVTFWGVPGDPRHDNSRGWSCIDDELWARPILPRCEPTLQENPPPFLVLPTSCTGPLQTSMEADSWKEEGVFKAVPQNPDAPLPALDGCNDLPFRPSVSVVPDVQDASNPSGLNVDVHVPQNVDLDSEGLSASDVKNITVALPAGVAINPSAGDGLEACSSDPGDLAAGTLGSPGDEIGYEGMKTSVSEPGVSLLAFSPKLPGSFGSSEALQPGVNFCANASKIAEVSIKSPDLPNPLKGFVYLAAQESNPFGSLLAQYLVAEDPVSGVLIKLAGEVQLCKGAGEVIAGHTCEALGQIVSTFTNNPQAPLEDAEFHFFGGERAPLAMPSRCGAYTTNASFAPWSGNEPVNASSTFDITSGPKTLSEPGGSPCPGASLPFSPSLTGGGLSVNAGWFSPFTLTMTRQDGEQNLQSVEAHLPPGLSGILSNVELCPEPQANLGECGPNSLIGETTVSVGVGGTPYTVRGGKFYLTGPYNGTSGCTVGQAGCAPFGITFEVPAKAGPFDLANTKDNHPPCDCVLVRGKIEVNPTTAAVTITSNPPGTPDAIPTSIEGIPLEIQHVNAITTRADFQFNPTNCSKMEVTGTIHSSEGAADTIGVPFQVTNCAALKFEPKFAVSTSAKTSRADGASLNVKLTYPNTPFGTQANIHQVKVELPKQLPSRLTTLQKACTAATFDANPAGCPAASIVGRAKAITPLIPVPLEGPAYFVSHGGEAFPSLVIVLQGYNVTIDLVGSTFIDKAGITSSTFKTVPDQPVGSFELTLPQGRYSALAANGNLCKDKLTMPTEFLAQNGAEIHESTKITVTGCPKAKHAKKSSKGRKHTKSKRTGRSKKKH